MDRRDFLKSAAATAVTGFPTAALADAKSSFDDALAGYNDVDAIISASGYRERFRIYPDEPLSAQSSDWSRASSRKISSRARDLIIKFEVSGRPTYEALLRHPSWPGERSGITIGIGYDLGYSSVDRLSTDWADLLDVKTLQTLAPACGLKGERAQRDLSKYRTVSIEWETAVSQFDRFLPCVVGKTEDTFPNTGDLRADSLGALASLIYNRGPSLKSASRREMQQIYYLMKDRNFAPIPQVIRDMKRIWTGKPKVAGLLVRRELEARLFEAGLG